MRANITPSAVTGTVAAPPSKSYTHRAVIIGTLAIGETVIGAPLLADDTLHTIEACRRLGAVIERRGDDLVITGSGGRLSPKDKEVNIFAGNSGTTLRLVAGLAALVPGRVVLDGDQRLRQRPVADLMAALTCLGVAARSLAGNGCPPVTIQGGGLEGGKVTIPGEVSSQPVSSLLLVAPYARKPLGLHITGKLHSRPYVAITLEIMRDFGVAVTSSDFRDFAVAVGQGYRGRHYRVEGDYSSAAYFLAAGAIGGGPVTVTNLRPDSAQGDRRFLDLLAGMGCTVENDGAGVMVSRHGPLKGISADMGDCPDIVPTLAVVAACAPSRTEMTNIGHLRFKESDRIRSTAVELGRMGIRTEAGADRLVVYGGAPKGAVLDCHNDHRLAMSFAVAALFADGPSTIHGAEAVSKSYPRFFDILKDLGAGVEVLA